MDAYPFILDSPNNCLFFNTRTRKRNQPTTRKQAWKLISSISEDVGLHDIYGTHTLRKTRGYHACKNGVELTLIIHKLNHNSLAYTKRYLGITNDELETVMRNLNLDLGYQTFKSNICHSHFGDG